MSRSAVIAITMGDPGGIGPEVLLKALKQFRKSPKTKLVILGIPAVFDFLKKKLKLSVPLKPISFFQRKSLSSQQLSFFDISDEAQELALRQHHKIKNGFDPAKISYRNAAAAYAAILVAAKAGTKGEIDAIVTAPVNKTAMRLIDSRFHGHTELLAKTSGSRHFAMMFASQKLTVTLVTIHVALKKVSSVLKADSIIQKTKLTHEFLKKHYGISNPKIAVCALNPHGPETGTEENKTIIPAMQKIRRLGISAAGPFSADQLFHEAYHGQYDALIAMYHDQGLAPFKMIAFHDGVNVTLGLPFVRTSPDHGTAYDIAYKGKADARSMISALRFAEKAVLRQLSSY